MRLISAVVAVVFAVPVGGTALCADTTQKWLDRFTSANSTDTSADSTPEEAAAGFESGPFGIVFNEVRTYTPSVRGEEPQEKVKDTVEEEEPVGEAGALEEPPVREVNPEYTPVVGKALFSTSEAQSQESASPGIRAAADETPAAKAASDAIQWPEGGFTGETTITYDANGKGTFADGATTNVVTTKYDGFKDVTKYAHTDNLDDAGVKSGGYGDSKLYSRVVTIPGAKSLTVDITYQTEGTSYDWVCAYAGGTESSPAGDAQCSTAGSLTGKLGGQTKTTKSFTVDGDSVTFWFKSDGGVSDYYGYYAVVKGLGGSKETVSGTYAAPVDPTDDYHFVGWNTKPDGTGEDLGADEAYLPLNQTVYAKWKALGWEKWNTVGWCITSDGTLKLRPWKGDTGTTGSATYADIVPWYSQRSKIRKIESIGNIILNANSASLFFYCTDLTDLTGLESWNVSNVTDMRSLFYNCSNLTDLTPIADWNVSNIMDMSSMFSYCSNLTDLTPLASWNVSNVTNMGYVFSNCSNLTNLTPLVNWDVSNVLYMNNMFDSCSNLTDLTLLESWNVSNVTNMCAMFYQCTNLINITSLSSWNVSNVTTMERMFSKCSSLTDLSALANWVISNVTNMSYMFYICSNLTDLSGLKGWNVSNVTNMSYMFSRCSSLTDLTSLAGWNVSNVTNMNSMFNNCSNLSNLSGLENWNVSKVTSMSAMLSRTAIENVDPLSNWDVSSVNFFGQNNYYIESSGRYYSYGMFESCSNLSDISGLSNWVTSSAIDMYSMFKKCSKLSNIDSLSNWDVSNVEHLGGYNNTELGMFSGCSDLTDITGLADWNVSMVKTMDYMFSCCSNLASLIPLEDWSVSNVMSMSGMFSKTSIERVDPLSHWDVSNVKYFGKGGYNLLGMFESCSNLSDISGLSNWVTSSAIDMRSMFKSCSKLSNINPLSNWDVRNVKYFGGYYNTHFGIFSSCANLTDLTALESWDVSNVMEMGSMFSDCSSLTDLSSIASWDVSNVTNMKSMFSGCSSLSKISALSSWNVSNVTNMSFMFQGCSSLTDLTGLESWNVSKVTTTSHMFIYCSNLIDISSIANWNISRVQSMDFMFAYGSTNRQKIGIPSIANGGQNLVNNAKDARLNSYLPTIILEDFTLGPYSWNQLKSEMQTNPDAFQEGTVWVKYTPSWLVSYNANDGVGSMSGAMTPVNQTLTLPEASYLRFGYKFTGWTTQPDPVSDTNPLMKPGQIFDPYDKTDGKRYTLYAQWEKLDNTDDLPSSSQSGMLPGWVQVESGNTTGLIPPSSSITAWFKNKYAPGSTSLSLQFTKLLEGNAPDRVFQFDLYDVVANKVVQSVQNVGSAVKFDPLVFTKEGVYTYYVRESNTTDDKLIYDNSLRQVTVTVTADKDDPSKLTATAQILGDVTFNNKYKTASLKIRKTVEGTEAKDKDFSFMVDVTKSDGSKLEGTYPTQTGDSPGSVTFKEGIATLQLRADEEVAITGLPANSKYSVDETSLPKGYSIKNLSNPDGMLTPADTIEVTAENRYTTTPGIAQLKALKRYVNAAGQDLPQKNGMFEFAVCEVVSETECNGIGEAQSNDRSEVVFPVISYTDAGNHTYRISEIIGSNTSIAYDRALVTAEVAVTDNGEGELVTTIVYKDKDGNRLPEGELPVFVNRDASASIIPVTGSLAVWSFVAVFGAVALWFASRYIRTLRTGKTGAHAKR